MSILNTITGYAHELRARRLRARTYLEITSLPREIQKDIGWPDAYAPSDAQARSFSRNH